VVELVVLVVIGTSIWVYFDARTLAYKQNPWLWAAGSLLLWIVFFPWYLATRRQSDYPGV